MASTCFQGHLTAIRCSPTAVDLDLHNKGEALTDYGDPLQGLTSADFPVENNVQKTRTLDGPGTYRICCGGPSLTVTLNGLVCPGDTTYDAIKALAHSEDCAPKYFSIMVAEGSGLDVYHGPAIVSGFTRNSADGDSQITYSATLEFSCINYSFQA